MDDLFSYPQTAGYKRSGTSFAAARSVDAKTLRNRVMVALQSFVGGATADECAGRMGISILSVRPRFSELRALGLIVDTGRRRPNSSGRQATVFDLAPDTMALAA